jgi:hypothetical protein
MTSGVITSLAFMTILQFFESRRPQSLCADVDLAQGVRDLAQRASLTPQQPISLKSPQAFDNPRATNSGRRAWP